MIDDARTDLVLRDRGPKGRGVLAGRAFHPGETVLVFHGALLDVDEIDDFTHVLQVGDDVFLGPSGDLDDFVNHSCDPNCALEIGPDAVWLRALRVIPEGEELTFDYSLSMSLEPAIEGCLCGAPCCRGRIAPFQELDAATRARAERQGLATAHALRAARG